jgi:hypothetical protein
MDARLQLQRFVGSVAVAQPGLDMFALLAHLQSVLLLPALTSSMRRS